MDADNSRGNILVKYLVNRNRTCHSMSDKQVDGVILNILSVRKQQNRQGGRKLEPLSTNAARALQTKRVGRRYFRRLNTSYPQLARKNQHKVSAKRGLRCTRETAIRFIDDLATDLIEYRIAPDLVKGRTWSLEGNRRFGEDMGT